MYEHTQRAGFNDVTTGACRSVIAGHTNMDAPHFTANQESKCSCALAQDL